MAQSVSGATVAKALNLTERRIQQLAKEGMPRAERGQYDPWACALWYIRYLQKAVESRVGDDGDGTASSWREEKKRLLRLQANNVELDYKKKLGEVIPVEMARDTLMKFTQTAHDRFIALSSKVAPRLEGESRDVIRLKLYEAVRDTLNGLASQPIDEEKQPARAVKKPAKAATRKKSTGRASVRSGTADHSGKSRGNHPTGGAAVRGRA
jgi:phage terminase Nu1 subunit (DNA packaging protein)